MTVRAPLSLGEALIAVRLLLGGRTNAGGELTCATGTGTTTVVNAAIQAGDTIVVTPKTAAAGAELASGNFFVPDATVKGAITVHHTSSAVPGRTFAYEVRGA